MIVIKSLNKSYGNKIVLKDINLSFKRGEIVGIVGENGAGKTTLFKCITGLENYQGSIEYDNGIIKNTTGFLPTNPYSLSRITGIEYLQLLVNARKIKTSNLKDKNIFDLPLNQFADTYSNGMMKKLALTGILLQDKEIFILDEPFNGVDIHSNIMIKEVLSKLKELDKIIIISSHIFSTLNETCDLLHYLKNGEIIRSADRSEFEMVEDEMKGSIIGNRIDKLGLK
ncbi:MAG: ATP-binding cassette domain-containing protein [Candidatus Cloacimonetes bacterium]|nr:ATP-binding cassette domain-containing protein [Candidatus Cloacimonadota bacterium]